jgi:hypothetical protein
VYTIRAQSSQRPAFLKRVLELYKEKGIITLIDSGINKILIFLGKKTTGVGSEIDFVFIIKKIN